MRLIILAAVGLVVSIASVNGARKEDVLTRAKEKSGDIKNSLANKHSLNQILALDGQNSFQPVRSIKTKQGSKKVRANQLYAGLEVYGANAVYTVDDNGDITGGLSGSVVVGIDDDIDDITDCMLSYEKLFSVGKEKAGLSADCTYCFLEKKKVKRMLYFDANVKLHIAYEIWLQDETPNNPRRINIIIDACDFTTLDQSETISNKPIAVQTAGKRSDSKFRPSNSRRVRRGGTAVCPVNAKGTGGNAKTGDYNYGFDPYCLDVDKRTKCRLETPTVKVVDLHQTTDKPGVTYKYDCEEADDGINGANSPDLDAFFFATVVNDVYQTYYGMTPLEGLTSQILLYIHYGSQYENAFWNGRSVTFGDGRGYFYPLVGLDIVAHEIAHGITELNSDLKYSRQSGGMNEAFSDISGEAVEYLSQHLGSNDWTVGYEITKGPNPARYFADPTLDGRSIAHVDDYRDSMDVHYTSGIYNKAFYELVAIQGVPMLDAYGSFLDANKIYWGPNTQFADGACGVKMAALDRGVNGANVDAAFAVVGINTNCCGVTTDTLDAGTMTDVFVSKTGMTCFTILPRSRNRRFVRIRATSDSGEIIFITITKGICGDRIARRKNAIRYKNRKSTTDIIVCFSSRHEVDDVTIETKYCKVGRKCRL